MIEDIMELFKYKEMLKNLVRKDLRTRYKGSFLGFLWTFINPLLMLLVYSIVFPYLLRIQEKNYAMFLFVALIPWMFFSTSLQNGVNSIVWNNGLIKKIYFPRLILPIATATSGLMNCIYSMIVVIISLMIMDVSIKWYVIFLPLLLFIQYLLVLGFCIIFSCINVYFRDLEHILGIVLQAWYFLTPVLYRVDVLPKNLQFALKLNPMSALIISYRDVLYDGKFPNVMSLVYVFIFSIFLLIFSILIFNKLKIRFAEEI
ncbi:ABC-2 type transport system permease protein [Caloramator quimbayensis]|uniref:Transport permease protein n=1 Tax=Caloramator quimbayensis TaxID=1147123 RepID=A0A1T4WH41_9CLOT|nr:ABC transporter permease [Caloramator quimbayensis]SKA76643.1 ABC-2 type transport system permease protein [Caloramator quimbayensis]